LLVCLSACPPCQHAKVAMVTGPTLLVLVAVALLA
jgi:hypothetical protein